MNLSGILVVVSPKNLEESIRGLSALPGVDVHHADPSTGKIVITQEAASVEAEVEGLKRIKSLPGVMLAEMIQHYIDPEGSSS